MLNNWRLKKVYGVKYFYTDPDKRYYYYYRRNSIDQFDIMVYDIAANSNRWFMVTSSVFFSFIGLLEYNVLMSHTGNIADGKAPLLARNYVDKFNYKMLAYNNSKVSSSTVVGLVSEYGPDEDRKQVLLLKRIASIPIMGRDFILGIDTLEIPLAGVNKFVKLIKKKYFKGVDIVIEPEEEENGSN